MAAVIAGILYAWMDGGQAEGPESRSIEIKESGDIERSLQTVSDAVGFQAETPSFFPTSATRLVLVESSVGARNGSGGNLLMIEQIYESDQKFTFKGHELVSAIELFQLPVRLNSAQGERMAVSNPNFDIYRQVVDKDEAGTPVKVTYTALGANKSFVIDFTGEQPSDSGIVRMLESFRPVPRPTGPDRRRSEDPRTAPPKRVAGSAD